MKNRKWTAKEIIDHAQTGRKPKDSIQSAHMAGLDYAGDHHCRVCGKPVRIAVRHPLSVVLVMQHWHDKLDGKCKACLEAAKAKPLYDYCEDVTGTDIDARRVPASVVEGRARHHVLEEMEREG
jgi:hypothetical protein